MSKWNMVKWSQVVEIKNGRNQKAVEDSNGQYPIYGSGGVMGYANNYICDENTVIIGRKGNINKPIYVSEKFWNVDTAFGLNPNREQLFPKYLYYFCVQHNFEQLNTTVTIPSLTKSNLLNIEIPLPPLDSQKQIAKTLDTTAELLAMRKQQLAELDNLIKSQFIEIFGDPVTNSLGWDTDLLEKYANVLTGNPFDSSKYSENGIKICGGLIIMPDRIAWEDAKYWNSSVGLEKYLLEENDIVFAMDRPWISSGFKIGQISRYDLPALLIQRTARIRAKNMNQSFMNWMISSQRFLMHCKITETTVPHISIRDIKSFEILVPPIELQNQFANIVTKIEEQKALVKKAIDETQQLFDSLMSDFFE